MRAALALVLLLLTPGLARAQQTVMTTRHNLSVSGPGPIKAQSERQVCVFCHVPHGGAALGENRPLSGASYTPYNSSTLASPPPGAPTGASRVCLSCHDGTIAVGQTLASGTISTVNTSATGTLPTAAPSNLGTDLSRSHPVSLTPAITPELRAPPVGDAVKLDGAGRVQCTSCHDPHRDDLDPVQGKFLVKSNRASAMCLTCHVSSAWQANPSAHQSSTAFYDTSLGATTPYTTVADNGCESCHRSHSAADGSRNLKDTPSQVCMQCHNGRVAAQDLASDLAKTFSHRRPATLPPVHDAAEAPSSATHPLPESSASAPRHAECVDCHEPHASYARSALAPRASGALAGVWGIDRNGQRVSPVQNEYEVCFKCHADSANQPQASGPTPPETVQRLVTDVNLRRVFDLGAASFHPVEGPGRNLIVPGLIAPLTTASVIYCSDCHASDQSPAAGGTGPKGPHGSVYPHILALAFSTQDLAPESPSAYALCYRCHDRATLLSSSSNFTRAASGSTAAIPLHQTHVVQDGASCAACHDPHGVSSIQGNSTNNAHLVNFDISVVQPNAADAPQPGVRQYSSAAPQHGNCTLTCHGHVHDSSGY